MSTHAESRAARELQMMESLVDGAYALGMAFSAAARAEGDIKRQLPLLDAYLRASQAVRLGIRLSMALRAGSGAGPSVAASAASVAAPANETRTEGDPAETDPSEAERPDRAETERERDRDYEPVSLPKFLATLGVVAGEAERLGDRLPAEAAVALPTLRELLARATADAARSAPLQAGPAPVRTAATPSAGLAVMARRPHARTALLRSASAGPSRPNGPAPPRPPPRAPG